MCLTIFNGLLLGMVFPEISIPAFFIDFFSCFECNTYSPNSESNQNQIENYYQSFFVLQNFCLFFQTFEGQIEHEISIYNAFEAGKNHPNQNSDAKSRGKL